MKYLEHKFNTCSKAESRKKQISVDPSVRNKTSHEGCTAANDTCAHTGKRPIYPKDNYALCLKPYPGFMSVKGWILSLIHI